MFLDMYVSKRNFAMQDAMQASVLKRTSAMLSSSAIETKRQRHSAEITACMMCGDAIQPAHPHTGVKTTTWKVRPVQGRKIQMVLKDKQRPADVEINMMESTGAPCSGFSTRYRSCQMLSHPNVTVSCEAPGNPLPLFGWEVQTHALSAIRCDTPCVSSLTVLGEEVEVQVWLFIPRKPAHDAKLHALGAKKEFRSGRVNMEYDMAPERLI